MPVFPKSWKQQAPINFWRTWLNGHVTTHALSEGSPPLLSRLQWKTTAAATVFPAQRYTTFLFSLLVCACLFVTPPFLISLCQHIPQTHPPSLPSNLSFWMEIVRGGGKKLGDLVGIYVSWPNRLHMLIVMTQDVADRIYLLFSSSKASLALLSSLWFPFLLLRELFFCFVLFFVFFAAP